MISLYKKAERGFSLIEVIISIAVAAMVILAITDMNYQTLIIAKQNMMNLRANLYLTEAIEAAKDLEVSNWSALTSASCTSSASPCKLTLGSTWALAPGSDILDGIFTRTIWVEPVQRTNGCAFPNSVVSSGGTVCPGTKKVVSSITWTDPRGSHTKTIEAYVYSI